MKKIIAVSIIVTVIIFVNYGCGNRVRIVPAETESNRTLPETEIEKAINDVKLLYNQGKTREAKRKIYEILEMIDQEKNKEISGQLKDLVKEIK